MTLELKGHDLPALGKGRQQLSERGADCGERAV
jgi:hypothetical protein